MEETTVLIIEDDSDILEVLSLYVQNAGYDVLKASTVKEGREMFSSHSVDLVLIDINLPDGSGVELGKEIYQMGRAGIRIFDSRSFWQDWTRSGSRVSVS